MDADDRPAKMFVAVWPDRTARQTLAALDLGHLAELRPVTPEQWHVTVRFLGGVARRRTAALAAALDEAARSVPGPLTCTLGPRTEWLTRHVLVVPVTGLDPLAAAIFETTRLVVAPSGGGDGGPGLGTEPFRGHLTLARSRARQPRAELRRALEGHGCAVSFTVEHVDLVESVPVPGGRRYDTVARSPLVSSPGSPPRR